MDSAMLERLSALIRVALAEDTTPQMEATIETIVAALRAAEDRRDLHKFLIFLSTFAGQATRVGIVHLHNGRACQSCGLERIADFATGLGFKTDMDEGPDAEGFTGITLASVH